MCERGLDAQQRELLDHVRRCEACWRFHDHLDVALERSARRER